MNDMPEDVAQLQERLRRARDEFRKMAKRLAEADMKAMKAENLLGRIQAIINGEGVPEPMMCLTPEEFQRHQHLLAQVEGMASDQASWVSHLMATGQM